ncbi:hypothetical protein D3C80_1531480 [compost metagenome]
MRTVKGTCQHRHQRKLVLDDFGNPERRILVINTDQNGFGRCRAPCMQDFRPRTITVINLEAELGGLPDKFRVLVNQRQGIASCQQRLADNLAETSKANQQDGALNIFRQIKVMRIRQ